MARILLIEDDQDVARQITRILGETPEAEQVTVEWPEGQDYPSEVYIDESSRIADEEIGYSISDVAVG